MKIEEDPLYEELRLIEEDIKASEGESVGNRWAFGMTLVLRRRDGKQLPKGVLAAVMKKYDISRSEIHRRMQLAQKFTTEDEVSHAWDKYGSWRRLASEALPKKTAPKPSSWDERISNRLNRIIDDAVTEEQFKTLAELLHKAIKRVEVDR